MSENKLEQLTETREHIEQSIHHLAKADIKCPRELDDILSQIGKALITVENIERQIDSLMDE